MIRNLKDASLIVEAAQPNAANTVNTASIDLESSQPGLVAENFVVEVTIDSTSNVANSKNVNVVVQQSDDNITFAAIPDLATAIFTSNTSNTPKLAAQSKEFRLPTTVKRYIRASATGEANGGDASADKFRVALKF